MRRAKQVQRTRELLSDVLYPFVSEDTRYRSGETKRYTFYLNLDPAVSVPVAVKDVHASKSFLDGLDSTARNPTGKFYKDSYAVALVDTLRSKKSYARVVPSETTTDEQKKHFERFVSRLQAGELV